VLGARKRLGRLVENQIRQLGETVAERARPFETMEHYKSLSVGAQPAASRR
jgi:hypothetical protein